jgi:selT/selW/selH-like putative selenoprotein
LKQELDADVELIAGGNGIFDVIVDGNKVFSRHNSGRFPDEGEIISLLK